jgi:hypothetical protein
VTTRPTTLATAFWSPPAWASSGLAGPDQRTTDLSALVQEVVNRGGWSSGNSLVVIISGTGNRLAEAYDGLPNGAPLIHIEYTTGS